MSGGSLNYLYRMTARELVDERETLAQAAEAIEQLGFPFVAYKVREITLVLDAYEQTVGELMRLLEPTLHSVEWFLSNDYGAAEVKVALQAAEKDIAKAQVAKIEDWR